MSRKPKKRENKRKVTAVVLAAGKSKRTRTQTPKVLLPLAGQPLSFYLLETLIRVPYIDRIIMVVGNKAGLIRESVSRSFPHVLFARQKVLNGTAKAVEAAFPSLAQADNVLVLCADTPLMRTATLKGFLTFFFREKAECAVVTSILKRKNDYGRIIRDKHGRIQNIVEKVDVRNEVDREEVNSGVYCFKREALFDNIRAIPLNTKKKEYFLTDIVDVLYRRGAVTKGYVLDDHDQTAGVNTQQDLAAARKTIHMRLIEHLMDKGVTIIDPTSTFVSFDTKIGSDTVVYPFTYIEKNVIIGRNCHVGPFIHIRSGTTVKDNVKVGNFTELNRAVLNSGVRMKHLGYVGDTTVEENVNIGAGTVVANYDGVRKHQTRIKKGAFIGSDTVVVAPAVIGIRAATGAGSVVTHDVADHTCVAGVPARFLKKTGKNKKRPKAPAK